jgi:WD40 repeat protein
VPAYVLRGHESPVHALRFCSSNALLASGDGDGWMVIWRLSSKRPVAVWKGHSEGVVAIHWWMDQRLVRWVGCKNRLCSALLVVMD